MEDNYEIFSPYIGELVINVHRSCESTGKILSVEHGCNGLIEVEWANCISWCCPNDLALKRLNSTCYRWDHQIT